MSRHTAGPWNTGTKNLGDPDVLQIGCYESVIHDAAGYALAVTFDGDNQANARLIAAAPDLLEALKDLRKQLNWHIKFNVKKHFSLMVADVAASKAIARATGSEL